MPHAIRRKKEATGFNARWQLHGLAAAHSPRILELRRNLLDDFDISVNTTPAYRLDIAANGNHFVIRCAKEESMESGVIPSEPGFYSIFTSGHVTYLGEAGDLRWRFFRDEDGGDFERAA